MCSGAWAGRQGCTPPARCSAKPLAALFARRAHLPPSYQHALDAVESERMRQHFAPGHVALGSFDAMTFGVPLGFYHLAASTAQGMGTLAQGHYEQATQELAPAALLVALYAGRQKHARGHTGRGRQLGRGCPTALAGAAAGGAAAARAIGRGGVARPWRATSSPGASWACWSPRAASQPRWRCMRPGATCPRRAHGCLKPTPRGEDAPG